MSRHCKTIINIYAVYSHSWMNFKQNLYKLKEGREMKAETFSKLVATSLYEKRYVIVRLKFLVNHLSSRINSLTIILDLDHTLQPQLLQDLIKLVRMNIDQLFALMIVSDTENTQEHLKQLELEENFFTVFARLSTSQTLVQKSFSM